MMPGHRVNSTRHPDQLQSLWDELCAAKRLLRDRDEREADLRRLASQLVDALVEARPHDVPAWHMLPSHGRVALLALRESLVKGK